MRCEAPKCKPGVQERVDELLRIQEVVRDIMSMNDDWENEFGLVQVAEYISERLEELSPVEYED